MTCITNPGSDDLRNLSHCSKEPIDGRHDPKVQPGRDVRPATGDRLRRADTELVIEVEKDLTTYWEAMQFSDGRDIRHGMGEGQGQSRFNRAGGALDTVITNAPIVDHTGTSKADGGLCDGRIAKTGKAGNPGAQPGIDIVIGPGTEAIAGEGKIHTDTLNESGFVENTVKAMNGRTFHAFRPEGAGGGHAPDIIRICDADHVLLASTNPPRPFTLNTLEERLGMRMVCHHLDKSVPEKVAFAQSRVQRETITAEDIQHDLGTISIIASDSQAIGRVGEGLVRPWQTAAKMNTQPGRLAAETGDNDNDNDSIRVRHDVANIPINPAMARGMGGKIGSVAAGKRDLVL